MSHSNKNKKSKYAPTIVPIFVFSLHISHRLNRKIFSKSISSSVNCVHMRYHINRTVCEFCYSRVVVVVVGVDATDLL